jgi:hypothetical protein
VANMIFQITADIPQLYSRLQLSLNVRTGLTMDFSCLSVILDFLLQKGISTSFFLSVSLQIGIKFGDIGKGQDVDKLDQTIDYTSVTSVRNAIKVGKMYSVTLTPAKSGKIATIVITDANSNT